MSCFCHSFIISSKITITTKTTWQADLPSTWMKPSIQCNRKDTYDRNTLFLSSSEDSNEASDIHDDIDDDDAIDTTKEEEDNSIDDDSSAEEILMTEIITTDDIITPNTTATTTTTTTSTTTKEEKIAFLTSLGAITGRGEFMLQTRYRPSTQQQYQAVQKIVSELEGMPRMTPMNTTSSDQIQGTWELLFSTTQLFRHSPFFMAGRAVCTTEDDIQKYNWFCDMHRAALSISQIQSVRQIINTATNQLISEFEVNVGSIPFLSDFTPFRYSGGYPISITGAIVSTADITSTIDGNGWEIEMDTVQIKGSNIPLIRNLLDNDLVALQSRALANVLEQTISSYTPPVKPIFRTTYLDEQYRISRDMDDHIFVYVKTSNNTTPTNYEFVDADLGIGRLLEGFNDAITKLYI